MPSTKTLFNPNIQNGRAVHFQNPNGRPTFCGYTLNLNPVPTKMFVQNIPAWVEKGNPFIGFHINR